MKRICILSAIVLAVLTACNNPTTETVVAENDIDAARNFIQAALDGRWEDANKYMLQDSINVQLLETSEQSYRSKGSDEKRGYRESSINLFGSRKIGDSITIVNYSNSYRNKKVALLFFISLSLWFVHLSLRIYYRRTDNN